MIITTDSYNKNLEHKKVADEIMLKHFLKREDVLEMNVEEDKVTVTILKRNDKGKFYLVDGAVATYTEVFLTDE